MSSERRSTEYDPVARVLSGRLTIGDRLFRWHARRGVAKMVGPIAGKAELKTQQNIIERNKSRIQEVHDYVARSEIFGTTSKAVTRLDRCLTRKAEDVGTSSGAESYKLLNNSDGQNIISYSSKVRILDPELQPPTFLKDRSMIAELPDNPLIAKGSKMSAILIERQTEVPIEAQYGAQDRLQISVYSGKAEQRPGKLPDYVSMHHKLVFSTLPCGEEQIEASITTKRGVVVVNDHTAIDVDPQAINRLADIIGLAGDIAEHS